MDTEGLSDTNKDKGNDVKIFTLALLLSSMLMFNFEKVIAKDEIDMLSLATNVSQRIRISSTHAHADPDNVNDSEYA